MFKAENIVDKIKKEAGKPLKQSVINQILVNVVYLTTLYDIEEGEAISLLVDVALLSVDN